MTEEMKNKTTESQNNNKEKIILKWQFTAMALVIVFTLFIAFDRGIFTFSPSAVSKEKASVIQVDERTTNGKTTEVLAAIIPTGIPAVYGAELGISYDDVSPNDPGRADAAIEVLARIDRTTELSGDNLQRYINILYYMNDGMSCEFCCGARSVIFENGQAACGCAHSYAMRGLAKYLILNTDMIDEEILSEVGKWKVLFFPGIHAQKALIMEGQGIEVNYISLTTNENRGIEQGAAPGEMVGGC